MSLWRRPRPTVDEPDVVNPDGGGTRDAPATWTPGRRRAHQALEAPYDGVPQHLAVPLWRWIQSGLEPSFGMENRARQVGIDLRVPLTPNRETAELAARCDKDEGFMLDVVEVILERWRGFVSVPELTRLLKDANSAYRVRRDGAGLELRVAPGVRETVQTAVGEAAGTSAGEHLINAWNAAYGRTHDPVKAVSEAIKATEAALAAKVSPQNGKQTLGTMIRDVRSTPEKWTVALGGTASAPTVLAMMQMLWNGQTSRHGGTVTTRPETIEEARAAVHIAAALVQLGVSGAFDKS